MSYHNNTLILPNPTSLSSTPHITKPINKCKIDQ